MNYLKNTIILILLITFSQNSSTSNNPHFLDFKYILNESTAGKKAQNFLKDKLEKNLNSLKEENQFKMKKKNYTTKKDNLS